MNPWLRQVALIALIPLVLVGCGTEPTERFAQARAAAEDKNLDNFAKLFTRDSAIFLRNMVANAARSRIPYLKDPFSLLPEGDVEDVLVEGNAAVLKVKGRTTSEVRMFMENDEWSIDVFSLPKLWEPLGGPK
jgi:hypothetical protein